MSGVLHPVGPEPEQTYWIRRALVLGTALLLVIIVALIATATGSGSSAAAAPPPVVVPAATSASPSADVTVEATPAATPSASASSASPKADTTPAAKKSSEPKATTAPKPAAPVACASSKLRTTLTGPQRLKPKQHATFKLSLINGSATTCVVTVSPADFTLTISSGRDRIWTSAHCTTSVKKITQKVAAEDAVEWSMAWNGRRSAKACEKRPEIPRAGTYQATAHLDGAKAVTTRMILHA